MKPIIKWAGGKTQLLPYIREMLPQSFNNYYEPFAGGLAVLLDLKPEHATINDINPELINLYRQLQSAHSAVMAELDTMDMAHEAAEDHKEYYYSIRDLFNQRLGANTPEQAARLIYLNKHCFNGLYRVNGKGLFNVPFNNKKSGNSYEEKNLCEVAAYLFGVTILMGDFEAAVENATAGDFVFFDSPYVPVNPTSFTDYTKEGFDYEDHVRLAELFKKLSAKGVKCMLTNHNTELTQELYKDFNIRVVSVSRMINRDANNRKGEEIIVTNY